jgi:pimeloyl-ACP methyl ester carboxylesterase
MILKSLAAAVAAAVISGPALAQEAEHHEHARFESERLHLRIDGAAEGQGPDVILIPGLGSSPEVWETTRAHLGQRYRVHTVHVQGFGGAPVKRNAEGPVAAPVADEIARYIDEAGLEKPAIVGHSMGGTIGMMLAARHPDAVGRLMVVDMVPFMGAMFAGPTATAETAAPVADAFSARIAAMNDEQWHANTTATLTTMIGTEDQRAGPIEDWHASDRAVAAHSYRELITTDLRPELAKITAPVEVLYVAFNAPGMTPETTDAVYRAQFATLPGVELKRIDDSRHFVMLDQPQAFFAELDRFLAE